MDVNCATRRRKTSQHVKLCPKEEKNASLKKVSLILQKSENDRSVEDQQILTEYAEVVEDLKMRWHRRDEAKRRLEEIEEPLDVIEEKCRVLVEAIVKSEHLVVYTGAGISTAACIPDYRGSNGIWTRLQQGKDIGNHDLSLAEPTVTHMALAELYHKKILKYVVSQNCDGLHLRSGLPRTALSELHGNMYIEVCKTCKPVREYWRIFDVTENTARYSHRTMRRCYVCAGELTDTIVHFGERGTLQWPLNWTGACKSADTADTIICLGSSLKVLKKYPLLWQMNKPAKKRPNLYIVNLQWTPKDDCAILKINGKCDDVMKILMKYLGLEIPPYKRESDPIFHHATELNRQEAHTTNQPCLLKAPAQSSNKAPVVNHLEEGQNKAPDTQNRLIKAPGYVEKNTLGNVVNSTTGYVGNNTTGYVENNTLGNVDNNTLGNVDKNTLGSADKNTLGNVDKNTLGSADKNTLGSADKNTLEKAENNTVNAEKNTVNAEKNTLGNAEKKDAWTNPKQSHLVKPLPHAQTNFTIDNILAGGANSSAIMAAYYLNLQKLFLPSLTGLYPFQTSLLYSGLHSIINPIPVLNYEFRQESAANVAVNYATTYNTANCARIAENTGGIACDYCQTNYRTFGCQFYAKNEAVFQKKLQRFSKKEQVQKELICVCCDYTTDEDEDEDFAESEGDVKKIKIEKVAENEIKIEGIHENEIKIENVEENMAEIPPKKEVDIPPKKVAEIPPENETKMRIQPGWFGKGYKKNRKAGRKKPNSARI